MEVKVIAFYTKDTLELMEELPREERGDVIMDILEHFVNGTEPELETPASKIAYKTLRASIERTVEANLKRSQKMRGNQNARKQEPSIEV